MQPESAKGMIENILGNDLEFEGHFNKCFIHLKESQQHELIEWIRQCKEGNTNPIQSKVKKEVIGFVKRFGSNLGAILTKKKEGYFLILFLDEHKYYELEMNKLGF